MVQAPQSILEEILDETFEKLSENQDFDPELILKLEKIMNNGSSLDVKRLITVLSGGSP
ncbi:hypothetical protein [Methanobacterium sp. BAmetb5]|uniref:hypothetical protein n=1 Tax=Methanobacterium sp. BAmetb5 TaxID=2025351 RepID=UPI0025F3106D|nr:hypothetical protein [Methanobacterium sp. BAmetb5]